MPRKGSHQSRAVWRLSEVKKSTAALKILTHLSNSIFFRPYWFLADSLWGVLQDLCVLKPLSPWNLPYQGSGCLQALIIAAGPNISSNSYQKSIFHVKTKRKKEKQLEKFTIKNTFSVGGWEGEINFKDVVNKCSTSLRFQTGFRGGIFACQRDINSEALWEQQTWEAAAFIYSALQPVLRSIPKSFCCTLVTSYSTKRRAFNLVTLSQPAARGCSVFLPVS